MNKAQRMADVVARRRAAEGWATTETPTTPPRGGDRGGDTGQRRRGHGPTVQARVERSHGVVPIASRPLGSARQGEGRRAGQVERDWMTMKEMLGLGKAVGATAPA